MSNKYLEKVALSDTVKGIISPAWMEHGIAKKHGKQGPKGVAANATSHVVGTARQSGRGLMHAIGGGVLGGAAGLVAAAATKGKIHPETGFLGGVGAGAVAGEIHGNIKSTKNQAKEMHDKYREKKAAVDMLIESGVDFDTAVTLVAAKSAELYK